MNGWARLNACDTCKAVSESAMPSPVRLICIFKVVMPSVVWCSSIMWRRHWIWMDGT